MSHTASDFAPDAYHDAAGECARMAAAQADQGLYGAAAAVVLYRSAIELFRESKHPAAAERIAFCESEIARLHPLATGGFL